MTYKKYLFAYISAMLLGYIQVVEATFRSYLVPHNSQNSHLDRDKEILPTKCGGVTIMIQNKIPRLPQKVWKIKLYVYMKLKSKSIEYD